MDAEEFRARGREMADYIADYLETSSQRRPCPSVNPGYLREMIPDEAPATGESWEAVKEDIDRVIMPGMTHWQSPHFHAYFPSGSSYPAILGDMLSAGLACIGFSWAACPACTELEVAMMDWLAKVLQLPREFLFSEEGQGGGVIQASSSEAVLVALLSARTSISNKLKAQSPNLTHGQIIDKLVAYTSEEAHSCVERAALIALVTLRQLPTDEDGALRGSTLESAIREDKEKGLVPFFLCATVGTTPACSFDNLTELGPVCTRHGIWMHVDAAYAGSACICPEFSYLLNGVHHSMSLNVSPHKWMRVNSDCTAMWVKDKSLVCNAFETDPLYLKHDQQGQAMPDYRHWHIPMGRRFRSLKVWFVMRLFGIKGLQEQIRKDVSLAKEFEALVREDQRFEIVRPVTLSLVCFRLEGPNSISETLLKKINDDRRLYLVPSKVKGKYFLRFAICAVRTQSSDITYAWSVIRELTDGMTLIPSDVQ